MAIALQDQSWLISAPADFRDINRDLVSLTGGHAAQIRRLADTRLNINQLTALSTSIRRLNEKDVDLSPLSRFKLGVVGQSTTNLFCGALPAAAARHGVNLSVVESEYNQLMQEVLDPKSSMNNSNLDAILLCLDHRVLPFEMGLEAALEFVENVRGGFARTSKTPVIFETLVIPPNPLFGSYDRLCSDSLAFKIRAFNSHLVELAKRFGDYILDVESLATAVGTQSWYDSTEWNQYKLPFSSRMIPHYVDAVGRLAGAIRGLSRKCLVLDLDNTLWAGVIGDDGLEGIRIGQGDAAGEAHLNVQRMALEYRKRGILLAVCSKNDEENALLPFRKHPDMLLKEEHISAFVANWTDKATNLEAIATTLNIGLDALVFVDDNPAEREQIRQSLPAVSVPELPADPSLYAITVQNAGYFEAVSFSEDDLKRAVQYADNANRLKAAGTARNLDEFHASLEMRLEVGPFDTVNIPRVTQLINKTNQFNLTTQRYSQSQVGDMSSDANTISLQGRLADRFGDNGLVTVLIGRISGELCVIDTWLMSCRVLGRRVEEAILACLVVAATERGVRALRGSYVPTAKNSMVADLYERLGFKLKSDVDAVTTWEMSVRDYQKPDLPIEIHGHGRVEVDSGRETD